MPWNPLKIQNGRKIVKIENGRKNEWDDPFLIFIGISVRDARELIETLSGLLYIYFKQIWSFSKTQKTMKLLNIMKPIC